MFNFRKQALIKKMGGLALILAMAPSAVFAQGVDNLTFHGDNTRIGWNSRETALTPATVTQKTFGKLWQTTLEGGVCGSPLYVSGVDIAGGKTDVVYAATMVNSVFALDAATGSILWQTKRLTSPVTNLEYWGGRGDGIVGIYSTPVIDRDTNTIYVCGVHRRGLRQVHLVWALDIRTGKIKPGWPVTLKGQYKGLTYVAGQGIERGALTLLDGWVYIPFGGRGDAPPWHGWIMGVNTKNPGAPQRTFSASTTTDGGGIWSAGGLTVDQSGSLYGVTGNGVYDLDKGGDNMSQTIFRLSVSKDGLHFSHSATDYYTPANYQHLDDEDEDLGGATALVLPDQPGTSTPHLLFIGGKDGVAYLVNRDSLGGLGAELQKAPLFVDPKADYQEGIRTTSAYFDGGAAGRIVYVVGDGNGEGGGPGTAALQLKPDTEGGPMRFKKLWYAKGANARPTSPVVSSNGSENGMVWEVQLGERAGLRALDALTGNEIYNSDKGSVLDHIFGGAGFTSPVVANGKVYVGAAGVFCYGVKP